MDIHNHLNRAKTSLFRFEFLQEFNVPQETDARKMWRESKKIDREYFQRWWNFIRDKTAQGVKLQRVRMVKLPLNDYTKFELAVFAFAVNYGDDIRIIKEADFKKLKLETRDFWLIDNSVVLDMNYDKSGAYIDSQVLTETANYLTAQKLLWAKAVPLKKFKYK